MSRPKKIDLTPTDERFRFPYSAQPTACKIRPQDFDSSTSKGSANDGNEVEARVAKARTACNACSVASACLLFALVNDSTTKEGIYAATTPRQRTILRKRMEMRLGPNWVEVLATRKQVLREQAVEARTNPLPVPAARLVQLDRALNGPMPSLRIATPAHEQQCNRLVVGATSASNRVRAKAS